MQINRRTNQKELNHEETNKCKKILIPYVDPGLHSCFVRLWDRLSAQNELIIYPSKGQSQEQQDQDKFQCYTWAKEQSGFDPMAPPTASTPPPQAEAKKGGVGRGAVRGGLAGVAVGAIAGDAGKGAASGAVVGGVRRSNQTSQQKKSEQQWAEQESANYAKGRNGYNRAFSACMEGRDYTVK